MEIALTLRLTAQRLDYIANVLGQRPYAEVAAVLADIAAQVAAQQQAAAQAEQRAREAPGPVLADGMGIGATTGPV